MYQNGDERWRARQYQGQFAFWPTGPGDSEDNPFYAETASGRLATPCLKECCINMQRGPRAEEGSCKQASLPAAPPPSQECDDPQQQAEVAAVAPASDVADALLSKAFQGGTLVRVDQNEEEQIGELRADEPDRFGDDFDAAALADAERLALAQAAPPTPATQPPTIFQSLAQASDYMDNIQEKLQVSAAELEREREFSSALDRDVKEKTARIDELKQACHPFPLPAQHL